MLATAPGLCALATISSSASSIVYESRSLLSGSPSAIIVYRTPSWKCTASLAVASSWMASLVRTDLLLSSILWKFLMFFSLLYFFFRDLTASVVLPDFACLPSRTLSFRITLPVEYQRGCDCVQFLGDPVWTYSLLFEHAQIGGDHGCVYDPVPIWGTLPSTCKVKVFGDVYGHFLGLLRCEEMKGKC